MTIWIHTIVSVVIVSLISLVGIFTLTLKSELLSKVLFLMVSFAIGALFGDAFVHIIPESFENNGQDITTSLSILLGILIFFILERFIRWRHCHDAISENRPHSIALLNLVGDAAHNLIDGMVIGVSYLVSIPIGISTTLAVILHEIPQEIGDFGILLHGGYTIKKALILNFMTALTAIIGAIASLLIGPRMEGYTLVLLPMTAGGFIYIAGSGLIPELHHRCDIKLSTSISQFSMIILGIVMMVLLKIMA